VTLSPDRCGKVVPVKGANIMNNIVAWAGSAILLVPCLALAKLPKRVDFVEILVKRQLHSQTNEVTYSVSVNAQTEEPRFLEQIRLVNPETGETFLDRKAGLGEIEETSQEDGTYESSLYRPLGSNPFRNGSYELTLRTRNGEESTTKLRLDDLTPSDSPPVTYPRPGQVLSTKQPVVSFEDFRSSEFDGKGRRKLMVQVMIPVEGRPIVFQKIIKDPDVQRMSVGPLEDGSYLLRVSFKEIWEVDAITLVRNSETNVPFSIKTKQRERGRP
jgi:hypothetical protein